jgi:hypothetical protein
MALAETLEVNTVETFLSFINANPAQRQQLLDLAGAAEKLEEVQRDLADLGGDAYQVDQLANRAEGNKPDTTDCESTEADTRHADRTPPAATRAAPRIPLHRYEDLLIDGEVIRIEDQVPHARPQEATVKPEPQVTDMAPKGMVLQARPGQPPAPTLTNLTDLACV